MLSNMLNDLAEAMKALDGKKLSPAELMNKVFLKAMFLREARLNQEALHH